MGSGSSYFDAIMTEAIYEGSVVKNIYCRCLDIAARYGKMMI